MPFRVNNIDTGKPILKLSVIAAYAEQPDILREFGLPRRAINNIGPTTDEVQALWEQKYFSLAGLHIPGDYVKILYPNTSAYAGLNEVYYDPMRAPSINRVCSLINSYGWCSAYLNIALGNFTRHYGMRRFIQGRRGNRMADGSYITGLGHDFGLDLWTRGVVNFSKSGYGSMSPLYHGWNYGIIEGEDQYARGAARDSAGQFRSINSFPGIVSMDFNTTSVEVPSEWKNIPLAINRMHYEMEAKGEYNTEFFPYALYMRPVDENTGFDANGWVNDGSVIYRPWVEFQDSVSWDGREFYQEKTPWGAPGQDPWGRPTQEDILEGLPPTSSPVLREFTLVAREHSKAIAEWWEAGMPCDWQDWKHYNPALVQEAMDAAEAAEVREATAHQPTCKISNYPPTNPKHGDLWLNRTQGKLKVYYSDENTEYWIDV